MHVRASRGNDFFQRSSSPQRRTPRGDGAVLLAVIQACFVLSSQEILVSTLGMPKLICTKELDSIKVQSCDSQKVATENHSCGRAPNRSNGEFVLQETSQIGYEQEEKGNAKLRAATMDRMDLRI